MSEKINEPGLDSKAEYSIDPQRIISAQDGDYVDVPPSESKRVLRKIDLCILPLMGFCYMLQYMDKLALTSASLLGLIGDLNLRGSEYSWCASIFYLGYLVWSWPSSYLIVRFPTGKYIAVTVFIWGIILMCHGACKNFAGLMVTRFFLGVGEAAVAPGFALITSMFYTRKEQPVRQAGWFFGNCLANAIGGVIGYGIGQINSSLESWRLLFLILGAITSAYAIPLFLFLPDSPNKAVFLDENERQIAVKRTLENKTGLLDNDTFVPSQIIDSLMDPQLWFLALYTLTVCLANGGITSFGGLVVAGFGFSNLKALLVQMSIGAAQIIFLILTSGIAGRVRSTRLLGMIFNCLTSMAGLIMVYECHGRVTRMAGLCLGAVFGTNVPLSLSLISSNVGGFTKRSVTSSTLFVAYCIGNIIGPQFYLERQKPRYQNGIASSLSGLGISAAFLIMLLVYYLVENRRRDKRYGQARRPSVEEAISENLSGKTDRQRPDFRYLI